MSPVRSTLAALILTLLALAAVYDPPDEADVETPFIALAPLAAP